MMAGQLVEIRGLDPLLTRCKGFQQQLKKELRAQQAKLRRIIVTPLATYPPAPANSHYERTGALGRGWERAVPIITNDGAALQLINAVTYAPFVQGEEQAKVHQGRWTTVEQVATA